MAFFASQEQLRSNLQQLFRTSIQEGITAGSVESAPSHLRPLSSAIQAKLPTLQLTQEDGIIFYTLRFFSFDKQLTNIKNAQFAPMPIQQE